MKEIEDVSPATQRITMRNETSTYVKQTSEFMA